MSELSIKILLSLVLLFLSALFSCSETAFFSLTRTQLHDLKRLNTRSSRRAIALLQKPRETLITILMGNEIVNVALAITIASTVYDICGDISWKSSTLISILIATPVILVFGEVVPKNIAVRFAKRLTGVLALPISTFYKIFFPVRFLLTRFADQIVKLFGGDPSLVKTMIMEEEFRELVDLGFKEGALEEGESELIHRLFELGNKSVSEIMTPAGEIFKLSLEQPIEKLIQEVRTTQYNRVPVYRSNPEDIVGTLHSRDLFRLHRARQRGHVQEIEAIIRPIHFVPGSSSIEKLLDEFQKLKIHVAMVLNKKRRIEGLVTMDDIFKVLFTEKLEGKKVVDKK